MRRLRVCLLLLLAATGLSGCAVDGSVVGRFTNPSAPKLLTGSRGGFGAQGSIQIVTHEHARDGQRTTTITSLQFRGVDIVSRESDGIDDDVRVLDGSAWSRGNPLYWVSSQGLEASQIPLVSRGWDAMDPTALRLPGWFVQALSDPSLLERCEVPSIPGGRLAIAGHVTYDGRATTVITDRAAHGSARERILVESGSPYLPEQISLTGGVLADPACGVSAATARTVQSESITFQGANTVRLTRPRATLSARAYEAILSAPADASLTVPAALARGLAGSHTMTGTVAATLGVKGDHVSTRMGIPWVFTPHCTGTGCHLTLSVGDGATVPMRAGRGGLFARVSFENRCSGGAEREIPTEIGVTDRGGRLRAFSSEATTACGGPSADYLTWQPS